MVERQLCLSRYAIRDYFGCATFFVSFTCSALVLLRLVGGTELIERG